MCIAKHLKRLQAGILSVDVCTCVHRKADGVETSGCSKDTRGYTENTCMQAFYAYECALVCIAQPLTRLQAGILSIRLRIRARRKAS